MLVENKVFPLSCHSETLPTIIENRVLILGSRLSRAFHLGEAFQAYLEQKGISELNVEVLSDVGRIEEAILGREIVDEDRRNLDLPKGVILLPEMRQYSPSGMGMSLNTYKVGISTFVEDLCKEYGVPLVEIREDESPEQITGGLKQLLDRPQEI